MKNFKKMKKVQVSAVKLKVGDIFKISDPLGTHIYKVVSPFSSGLQSNEYSIKVLLLDTTKPKLNEIGSTQIQFFQKRIRGFRKVTLLK